MRNIINGSETPETIIQLQRHMEALRETQKLEEIQQGGSGTERTERWRKIEVEVDEVESLLREIEAVSEKRYRIYFRCMNADTSSEVNNCITSYLVSKEGETLSCTDTLYIKRMTNRLSTVVNRYAARQCVLLAERLRME